VSATVVIGGTRSGKSAHAEALASASGLPVRYVATADDADPGMAARIQRHVERRPRAWATVPAGLRLADAVSDSAGTCVLLDGLGPWIATALHRSGAFAADLALHSLEAMRAELLAEVARTARALDDAAAAVIVCEQAGEGLLPADAASRLWLDVLGEATQQFAARADRVDLVVAGRAVTIGSQPVTSPDGHAGDLRRHGDLDVRPGDADHAVNVVAGGPPAWLRAALHDALDGDAHRYPSEDEALAALGGLHGRAPAHIVVTNGAAEALWLLGPALRPRLAACVHPAFTEAEAGLRAHGVPVVRVQRDPEAGFALDPSAVPAAADLVVVGNPASPSGTLDPATAILTLRRPGRTVVVDEAFMDLVRGEPGSLVREPLPDVIVVRSLTKALAVPGLRVGYAVSAPGLADRLRTVRPPWSANVLALRALRAAASHPEALAAIAERTAAERQDLERRLASVDGVRVWPGAANFCLIEVADGPRVVAALRRNRIAVRPAASFPGLTGRHIRVTARDARANARLAECLAAAVASA
jgi:histidinol-phosphate/aromatic aminotransferase/cobyric acid decarboxylase-like protein/adenosyl cobinamide kinase/adenosyl cobinamide phosphate guanylyltransferase